MKIKERVERTPGRVAEGEQRSEEKIIGEE